uniref:Uncharacterized protein n=1 Tax=Oryza brachyantha TaxID=4533 RepID=J3KZS9_ORYBR
MFCNKTSCNLVQVYSNFLSQMNQQPSKFARIFIHDQMRNQYVINQSDALRPTFSIS